MPEDAQKRKTNNDAVRKSREKKKKLIEEQKGKKCEIELEMEKLEKELEAQKNLRERLRDLMDKNAEDLTQEEINLIKGMTENSDE
jgi:hypothetical protein